MITYHQINIKMKKKQYQTPTLKIVSFQNETGFAASDPTNAGQFVVNNNAETSLFNFINLKDDNSADQNEQYTDGGTWEW